MIAWWRHRMLQQFFIFFYLTSCKTAERRGGRLAWAAGGVRDEEGRLEVLGWGGGSGGGSDRQTDRQTASPPAVPEQCSLRWNGAVAKNNISRQQQGSFHSHHSSGSLWAACDCPRGRWTSQIGLRTQHAGNMWTPRAAWNKPKLEKKKKQHMENIWKCVHVLISGVKLAVNFTRIQQPGRS